MARISHINMASQHSILSSHFFLTQVRSGLKFSPFLGLLVYFTHALPLEDKFGCVLAYFLEEFSAN
jgi:hypothetical protein